MTFVFAIAGPLGSGKSTLADYLKVKLSAITDDILYMPFARRVKEIALSMGWDGKKDEKGRRLLQLLGTECGRECIDPFIWSNYWLTTVLAKGPAFVIVDDLRFENEIYVIKRLPHCLIKIKGRNEPKSTANLHASEVGLEDKEFNHIYFNNRRLEAIETFADELIWEWSKQDWGNNK